MTDVLIPSDGGKMFEGKTTEELEKLLDSITPDGNIPTELEVSAEEKAPAETAPEPVEPIQEAEVVSEPEVDTEAELKAAEVEMERAKREKLEAALEFQKAHASRLAGEIGYLRKQFESMPRTSEPYEPQSQAELDRLTQLEQRFAEQESRLTQSAVAQAVESAINALDTPEAVSILGAEIAVVAPKYKEQLAAAAQMTDPELARQYATGIGRSVLADAKELHWDNRHKALIEKKAATVAENIKAKKASSPSASGAVPAQPPKPKTVANMTIDEADAWLRENVR